MKVTTDLKAGGYLDSAAQEPGKAWDYVTNFVTKAEPEAKQLPLMPLTPRQPSPIGWQIRQTSFKHNQSVIFPTAGNSTQGYEFPACNFSYPYYCSCVI